MKVRKDESDGREVYKRHSEAREAATIAICSFLIGAIAMCIVLHCFM